MSDGFGVRGVGTRNGHFADHLTVIDPHKVDRAEDRACLANRGGDPRERARLLLLAETDRDAVGRRRGEVRRRIAAPLLPEATSWRPARPLD